MSRALFFNGHQTLRTSRRQPRRFLDEGHDSLYLLALSAVGLLVTLITCMALPVSVVPSRRWLVENPVVVGAHASSLEDTSQWQFRLAGGPTGLQGRLEMRPNATLPWGTICKDKFKINPLSWTAACNSVGLVGVVLATFSAAFGAGTGPIYLTDVDCQPGEQFLENCTSRSALYATGSCVHAEDVGVTCTPPPSMWAFKMVNGTAPSNGIVLFRPMPSLPWGTIYRRPFIFDQYFSAIGDTKELSILAFRRMMCNTLGYLNVPRPMVAGIAPTDPTIPQYMSFMNCPATPGTVAANCTFYTVNGGSGFPLYDTLDINCDPPPPATQPGLEVMIYNPWKHGAGQVYVRPAGGVWSIMLWTSLSSTRGAQPTIPPTPQQLGVLKAVCHSAGYPNATHPMYVTFGGVLTTTTERRELYNCTLPDGSVTEVLANCSTLQNLNTYGRNTWTETAGVGIDCYPITFNLRTWEYRLVNGPVASRGILEMRPNSTSMWAGMSVFNTALTAQLPVLNAICRTLGFNVTTAYAMQFPNLFFPPVPTRPFYFIGGIYGCPAGTTPADNATLADCSLVPIGSGNRSPGSDLALDCDFPGTSNTSLWEYRFVQVGAVGGNGYLQTRPNPDYPWGVLSHSFGWAPMSLYPFLVYTAHALCRTAGFTNATTPVLKSFGVNPTELYGGSVVCPAGAVTIQDCPFTMSRGGFDPFNPYSLGVNCFSTPFTPIYRFDDGAGEPWRGRLMYQYDPNLPFGSVCNDLFKFNHIAWNAACRSAGFTNVSSARYRSYGPAAASVPIYLDDITCGPSALFLQNCTSRPVGQHNCFHGEDAGVDCFPPPDPIWDWQFRLADGTSATNGRVEMRPSAAHGWGSICAGPYFNHSVAAWEAACQSVGIASPPRARWRYFGKGADTVYLDNVSCAAGAVNLTACDHFPIGSYRCDASEVAGVDCDAPAERPAEWEFRLVPGAASNVSTRGRVEMRPSAGIAWGAVCRSHGVLSVAGLRAVCRSAGLGAAMTHPAAFPVNVSAATTPRRPYLDGSSCAPTALYAQNCTFMPLYAYDCDPITDLLHVDCAPTATQEPTRSATHSDSNSPDTASVTALRTDTASITHSPALTISHRVTPTGENAHKPPRTATASDTMRLTESAPVDMTSATDSATGLSKVATLSKSQSAATPTASASPAPRSATAPLTDSIAAAVSASSQTSPTSSNIESLSAAVLLSRTNSPPPTASIRLPGTASMKHTRATKSETPTVVIQPLPTTTAGGGNAAPPDVCGPGARISESAVVPVTLGRCDFSFHFGPGVLSSAAGGGSAAAALPFTLAAPAGTPRGLIEDNAVHCRLQGSSSSSAAASYSPPVLTCFITIADEKIVPAPTGAGGPFQLTFVLPSSVRSAHCVDAEILLHVILMPPASQNGPVVQRVLLAAETTAAISNQLVAIIADPTAYDCMAAVVALIARCATAADASAARIAKYLLSPLIDLGPTAVGIAHVSLSWASFAAHCAWGITYYYRNKRANINGEPAKRRRQKNAGKGRRQQGVASGALLSHHQEEAEEEDEEVAAILMTRTADTDDNETNATELASRGGTGAASEQEEQWWFALWAAVRFPSLSAGVAFLLYPGAGWALARTIHDIALGEASAGAPVVVGVLALHVLAVPSLAALAALRFDHSQAQFTKDDQPPQQRSDSAFTLWRRWVLPLGHWGPPASVRAFEGLRGVLVNGRGRLLFAAQCCLYLLVCALVGAPTRSSTCAAQHIAAGVVIIAASVAAAALRPFAARATTVLAVLGGLTLGLFLLLQGWAPHAHAVKAAVLVLNAIFAFTRSAHACYVRFVVWQQTKRCFRRGTTMTTDAHYRCHDDCDNAGGREDTKQQASANSAAPNVRPNELRGSLV